MLTHLLIVIVTVAQAPTTTVTVLDENYIPANEATVNVIDSSGRVITSAKTGRNGVASITVPVENVPSGLRIQAIRPGNAPSQPATVNWRLDPVQRGQLILLAPGTGSAHDIARQSTGVAMARPLVCAPVVCCPICHCTPCRCVPCPVCHCSPCRCVLCPACGCSPCCCSPSVIIRRATPSCGCGSYQTSTAPNRANTALLTASLPTDAVVFINGRRTTRTGTHREYASHNLQPGREYRYEVRAQVVRNGRTIEDTKAVLLRPGEKKSLDFDFSGVTSTPLAALHSN